MEMIAGAAAALIAGIFSAMGMGGGGILIIYFSLFTSISQLNGQGINVIFFVPIAAIAVIIYHFKRLIEWKIVLPFALFGIISSLLGGYIASVIDGNVLSKIFGGLLIVMGVRQLFSRENKKESAKRSINKNSNYK